MNPLQQYREKLKAKKQKRSEIGMKAAASRFKTNDTTPEVEEKSDDSAKPTWISPRNVRGYRHDGTPYHSKDVDDFETYSIITLGCLNDLLIKVQQHAGACEGPSPGPNLTPILG